MVYKVVQDHLGYIWIATDNGIVRCDGSEMKVYNKKDGLTNPDIYELYVDEQNRIWYSCKSDRSGYIQGDSIYSFPNTEKEVTHSTGVHVGKEHFIYDHDWHYFYLRDSIWSLEGRDAEIDLSHQDSLNLISIYIPILPGCVFGTSRGALYLLNKDNELTSLGLDLPTKDYGKGWCNTFGLPDGRILMMYGPGIIVYSSRGHEFRYFDFSEEVGIPSWKTTSINKIGADLSLSGVGATVLLDSSLKVKEVYKDFGLPDVFRMEIDAMSNQWYLTSNGLYFQSYLQSMAKHYFEGSSVSQIEKDGNQIVVGIDKVGARTLDLHTDQVQNIGKENVHVKFRNIQKIGKYIYIADDHSIFRRRKNTTEPFRVWKREKLSIKDFYYQRDTLMLIYSGSIYWSAPGYQWHGLHNKSSICLIPHQGEVYYGTTEGLFRIDNKEIIPMAEDSISSSVLCGKSLGPDLLIGTKGSGLYLLQQAKARSIPATENLSIHKIDVENDSIVWLSSDRGALRLRMDMRDVSKTKILGRYTQDDGLINDYIHDLILEDSILWAATAEGLSRINWKQASQYRSTHIFLKNKDTVEVRDRNYHPVVFDVIDFCRAQNLTIEYRFDGNSEKWHPLKTDQIVLSNLKPGSHQLQVRVRDLHGHLYTDSSEIYVRAKWHECGSVQLIFVLLAIFGLTFLVNYLTRRQERQKRLKLEEERENINHELSALRSQLNPHFIFNSLNAIQYYINENNNKTSEKFLTKFSELIRQVFEFSKQKYISLSTDLDMLDNYLRIEKMRFGDKLNYEINVSPEIDPNQTYLPSMLLQPFVENALIHGIFHKPGTGHVTINVSPIDSEYLKFTIIDDGIGLSAGREISSRLEASRKNSSSQVIDKRVQLLNKESKGTISYEIEELKKNGDVQGTKVTIILRKHTVPAKKRKREVSKI